MSRPSRSGHWRWLLLFLILVALTLPLLVWREEIGTLFADRDTVLAIVRQAGPTGPLVLIGLIVAQVIAAPIPGQVLNFAAGYLYGLGPGTLYSWVGLVLGSALAMTLARFAGRPLLNRLVDPERLARIDAYVAGRGLRFFALVFLIPFLPDDLICFAAGLSPLPLRLLVAVAAVARFPSVISAVWLGSQADALPWTGWAVAGALTLILALLAWRYGDILQARLLDAATRWSGRQPPRAD